MGVSVDRLDAVHHLLLTLAPHTILVTSQHPNFLMSQQKVQWQIGHVNRMGGGALKIAFVHQIHAYKVNTIISSDRLETGLDKSQFKKKNIYFYL